MRATKARRETGPSLDICLLEFLMSGHFKTWNGQAIAQAEGKPSLQCRKQIGPAFFERSAGCPHSAKRLDLCVKTLSIVYHFVSRLGKKRVHKILNHSPTVTYFDVLMQSPWHGAASL